MEKTKDIADIQVRQSRETDLLQALNAAAGSLQRSARSRQAVFKAFQEQVAVLHWRGSIMLLDEAGKNLTLKVLAYPLNLLRLLNRLGRQFDSSFPEFTFPVERSAFYQKIVNKKTPIYKESNTEVISQLLPEDARSILKTLINLFGNQPVISAPLLSGDQIQGVVNISVSDLTKQEIPVVEAFANHIAIALENADLITALEASESRQRLLFNQASDGIFVFNANGSLVDVNRSGCQMLGFERGELLGKHFRELISPDNLEEIPHHLDELSPDQSIVTERFLRCKDGSKVVVEVSAKLLPDNGMQAMVRDITARTQSEKALLRREKILEAIAYAAGQFLRLPSWEDGIEEVLSLLGKAADVSRVYIFRNHQEGDDLLTSQMFEWTAPGIPSQIGNPELQNLSFEDSGFGRWKKMLGAGKNIYGHVDDLPKSEQVILAPQGILSILSVPIFSGQNWWGFIGFDECKSKRDWETSEMDALQAAAGTIGAAIERKWINKQERQRWQEAEKLMEVTTALTSTLNLDQVLNNILVHLQQAVPFISACIFLIHGKEIQAVAGYQLPDENAAIGQVFPADDDIFVNQMRKTRQPVILEDAQKEPSFNTWGETWYIRGWMGVPLVVREKVIGYVTLDSDKVGVYKEKESRLAQAFVNQAAVAIENAQLFAETQRLLRQTREQSQQLQQVIDIVPDGILLLDGQKRVVSVNQAGEALLEMAGEFLENGRLVRIGPHELEELYQPVPSPPPWKELSSSDGNHLFEAAVWPLDPTQESDHWLLVIQDITEERAKQRYRSAQERLAIVGQMAAGIAHDFNNIMAVILLYTQMLMQMPNLPPKEEDRLRTIFKQSQRASNLIHQILDFSRQSLLERQPLSLQPFLQELIQLLKRTLPENIELILEKQEVELIVNADPTRIQQIIMNLALNARDAMPDGGSLKISVQEACFRENQDVPLPDMAPGRWVQLQVRDDGDGISADNLPHIFEPFFTTKPTGQGTGLGLAQVYGIVKQHEGFIDVKSAPDLGTTFTIFLPAFETEIEVKLEEPQKLPRTGKRETILVVEDDESARSAVVEVLDMLNYDTLSASNGAEALAIFENHDSRVDLVLSDMIMPAMDGTALHMALREIRPDVRMVLMTGYPLEQSGKDFLKQNVVAWMQKPLHTEQIAETVYQALHEIND